CCKQPTRTQILWRGARRFRGSRLTPRSFAIPTTASSPRVPGGA
ncbi:MAG: hypothetical protein AVDCRST_MAG86-785, partial [uncultured Truepera sp.]